MYCSAAGASVTGAAVGAWSTVLGSVTAEVLDGAALEVVLEVDGVEDVDVAVEDVATVLDVAGVVSPVLVHAASVRGRTARIESRRFMLLVSFRR